MIKVVHVKKAPYDLYIGRANGNLSQSKWANPWVIGKDGTREEVISRYETWIKTQPELMAALPELRGKVLGCWCAPEHDCHGNVLARLVEEMDKTKAISPVFYDHSSSKSPLTYWKDKDCTEKGPKSIVRLCKDAGLKTCLGVSPNFLTFPEAQMNLAKESIDFTFGLELWVCNEPETLTPDSQLSESKVIIRADTSQGYFDLKSLYSKVYTNPKNFYHKHRTSFAEIKSMWTPNLTLVLPFFDSFVCQNTLTVASIVPDLPAPPLILREVDSGLPFAPLIDAALDAFNEGGKYPEQRVKTIFYPTKAHFKAWQVFRCIKNRSSFQKPQLDFCCSDNFSFDDYKRLMEGES